MRLRIGVLAVMIALGLAAARPATGEGPAADPARAYIDKQAVAFSEAFARGDFETLASMYTEDAIAFPPDAEMVKGRPAIKAFWKGIHDSGVKGAKLTVMDVQSSGDLAAEVGTAVLTIKPPNQPEATQSAKYVVVWKRQKDGTWKLHRDIWNSVSAPKP